MIAWALEGYMPQWMQNLVAGWPMISANRPTFIVIVVFLAVVIWTIVGWSYSSLLASKGAQIELQDRQLSDYKSKLEGATPDQAKARIEALEQRLARLEPRRLLGEARSKFIQAVRSAPSSIALPVEPGGDSFQFSTDLAEAFQLAGWSATVGTVITPGRRPDSGLILFFPKAEPMLPHVKALMDGLNSAGIEFEARPIDQPRLELLVTARLSRN